MRRFRVKVGKRGKWRTVLGASRVGRIVARARGRVTVDPVETKAQRFHRIARSQIGVQEVPRDSNRGPEVVMYQRATTVPSGPWPYCMAGIVWLCQQAGEPLPYRGAYVPHFEQWARAAKRWRRKPPTPKQLARHAWAIVFDFDPGDTGSEDGDHVGYLTPLAQAGTVRTIEWNTSPGEAGSQDDGGGVWPRTRRPEQIRGYVRLTK